jgi:hypothetical protein
MPKDRYKVGHRLSPKGLFQLVAEEAFKDGKIEPVEQEILSRLARFLGIPSDSARRIAGQAKKKFQQGKLGTPRPLKPAVLYERVLYFAWSDGREDSREEKMLAGLRRLFRISPEDHEAMRAKVTHPSYAEGTLVDMAPPTEAISLDTLGEIADRMRAEEAAEPEPRPVPRPSPPSPRPEPPPPVSARPVAHQVGLKTGRSRFPLCPGGIPIPLLPHAFLAVLGMGAAALPLLLISALLSENQRLGQGSFGLAMAAGFGAYWSARKAYEASVLPHDAALVVSAKGIVVPGILCGGSGESKISRGEIKGLKVSKVPRGRQETLLVLHLQLSKGGEICLYETALDADFDHVCKELEAYLLRPIQREEESAGMSSDFRIFLMLLVGIPVMIFLVVACTE